jgi:hypothetical protein
MFSFLSSKRFKPCWLSAIPAILEMPGSSRHRCLPDLQFHGLEKESVIMVQFLSEVSETQQNPPKRLALVLVHGHEVVRRGTIVDAVPLRY